MLCDDILALPQAFDLTSTEWYMSNVDCASQRKMLMIQQTSHKHSLQVPGNVIDAISRSSDPIDSSAVLLTSTCVKEVFSSDQVSRTSLTFDESHSQGIIDVSTVPDEPSVDFLCRYGMPQFTMVLAVKNTSTRVDHTASEITHQNL